MPDQHPNDVPKTRIGDRRDDDVCARWWKSTTPGRDMVAVAKQLDAKQAYRRRLNTIYDRLYTGRKKRNIYDGSSVTPLPGEDPFGLGSRLGLNVIEAVIDTIASKVAKNRPRSYLLTEGGTWSLQRQGKQLMKFLDGLRLAQGVYTHGRRAFTDAMVFGTGHIKVSPDIANGEVNIERVLPDSIIVNDAEAVNGKPRTLFQKHLLHRAVVEESFAVGDGKEADRIKEAVANAHGWDAAKDQADQTSEMLWVYEGWSINGKHVIAIDHDDGQLFVEPWMKQHHPFAKICWRADTAGYWGIGLCEDLIGIQTEINNLLLRIQESHHLMAVLRIFTKPGAKLKKGTVSNETGIIIECEDIPTLHQGTVLPESVYRHLWDLFDKAFEIAGVSMMDASGRKEPGVTAAVAIQELRDIGTERFVLPGQDYEQVYVDTDRLAIKTASEMYNGGAGKDIVVRAPGTKFIETIEWSKVDLRESAYELKPWPTSIMPATPSGRLQRVQDLYQAGLIPDRETALSLLDAPDLEGTLSLQLSAIDDVKRILELITDEGEYEPPEPFINLELGARMANATFLKMRQLKGFPEARLDMLIRFHDACMDLVGTPDAIAAQQVSTGVTQDAAQAGAPGAPQLSAMPAGTPGGMPAMAPTPAGLPQAAPPPLQAPMQ
jgi:hypothetical protein